MPANHEILLRAMSTALDLQGARDLQSGEVNALGEVLGMPPEATMRVVQQLRDDGLVEFDWGGTVRLTARGRKHVTGTAEPASIHVGAGGVYVAANAHVSNTGAMGAGTVAGSATGSGAMVVQERKIDLGNLLAGLHELRHACARADLGEAERGTAKELEGEVSALVAEARKEAPDRTTVEQRLDRAKGLMERLAGITDAASKLAPVLKLIGSSLGVSL